MSTISKASHEWFTRPADQRFVSLPELHEHVSHYRTFSRANVLANRDLMVAPVDDDPRGLVAIDKQSEEPHQLTHWSFGQLSGLAGAPAGYLRTIPGPLAADCLNYGLHLAREVESVGLLTYKNGGEPELRAATGPNYGRIWNADIVKALMDRFGDGVTGNFRVPGEYGVQLADVTKANTTLYASDRDMFVFLADEERRIEIPNRRDGQPGSLARGFMVWNSEVGAATLGIATFLFDYACKNRTIWGAEEYKEIRIRHTSGAPHRWIEGVVPAIRAYAESSAQPVIATIEAARGEKIEPDKLDEFLAKRFNRGQVSGIKLAHTNEEGRPIETVWDAVVGATAYAKGIEHQDARVTVERAAGSLLREVSR